MKKTPEEVEQLWSWQYNVQDHFKDKSKEEIKQQLQETALPLSICCSQLVGDFNFGAVIRSANAFNVKEVFYYGKKHWDRRSAVGVHNYTTVSFLSSLEELARLKDQYILIGLENNASKPTYNITGFQWPKNSLILVGEEGKGLTPEVIDLCDALLEIPIRGSVRSYNAAVAASIAMYDYYNKSSIYIY